VYQLGDLRQLDISNNGFFTDLSSEILQLGKLQKLNVDSCYALTSPPLEVCKRGVDTVRQYYTDLAKGAGKSLPFATIALLGNTMAGKTSLIKTLQNEDRKRVLTDRSPDAVTDETTKVFNVEEVETDNTILRLIDMGGQEVYHIAYQLTLKQNCVPVIVVNMQQYNTIANETTCREAVRRLAFDYMSHLYLANPSLGAPKLVLTHKDKFSLSIFKELQSSFLGVSDHICAEIVREANAVGGEICQIQIFREATKRVFADDDIFVVGRDDEYQVFDSIKKSLLRSCQLFVKPLPKVWEEVNEKVLAKQAAYQSFWSTLVLLQQQGLQVEPTQLDIILTYMHDCGKILWYKNIDALKPFIFHRISGVTKLVSVLYHHDSHVWQNRCSQFLPCLSKNKTLIERQEFEELVSDFTDTGVLVHTLLVYLIKQETSFKSVQDIDIAICLLKSFRLLHGPFQRDSESLCFIVPLFAKEYFNVSFSSPKKLCLQTCVQFNGLTLPQYVYHQMSVGLLELFPDVTAVVKVKRNGANAYQDGIYTQLIHDHKSSKVNLYVSSETINISSMWARLVTTTNNMLKHVLETWTASRPVTSVYCAHCLLLGDPHPRKITNPQWCINSLNKSAPPVSSYNGLTLCKEEEIPSALLYPCMSTLVLPKIIAYAAAFYVEILQK